MITAVPGGESIAGEVALWIGCGGLSLGALALAGLGLRARSEDKTHFGVGFFICAIAAAAYFAMGTGQLDYRIGSGDAVVQFPRYIDWVVTTPLLLLSIWLVAMPSLRGEDRGRGRERAGLLGGILLADVLMIVTGIFATLNVGSAERWVWFAISSVFFVISLGLLAGPGLREARLLSGGATPNITIATRATAALAALWLAYPIVWGLGPLGAGVLSNGGESAIYTALDLLAKPVFEIAMGVSLLALARKTHAASGVSTIDAIVDELHAAGRTKNGDTPVAATAKAR